MATRPYDFSSVEWQSLRHCPKHQSQQTQGARGQLLQHKMYIWCLVACYLLKTSGIIPGKPICPDFPDTPQEGAKKISDFVSKNR